MYFDFGDRYVETPTVESAISWREQLLVSLLAHVLVAAAIVWGPRLSFVQAAGERRAERLEALAEAAAARVAEPDQTFAFAAPLDALDPDLVPPPDAYLSDQDSLAGSPWESSREPANDDPVAFGDSSEPVVDPLPPDPDAALDGVAVVESVPDEPPTAPEREDGRTVERSDGNDDATASRIEPSTDPGRTATDRRLPPAEQGDTELPEPGRGPGDPDPPNPEARAPDGLLARAFETVGEGVRRGSFDNPAGANSPYPDIQFDSKGVDFGAWIRRFRAQIYRNWFVPYTVLTNSGHVVLTFYVHDDGRMTDLNVLDPSVVESFNNSALNALRMSNPTQPLPAAYPDDRILFTVTFYFNEEPPRQPRRYQ